jgi:hypothetical protein
MQPCTVCGGVTVNATGHCIHCGTFRGDPAGQYAGGQYPGGPPTVPGYGPPTGGPVYGQPPATGYPPAGPYPVGGGPQPGAYPVGGGPQPGAYPVSGGPPGVHPGSGGPAYAPPTSGGGYPMTYPSPPGGGNRARPFVVPLVALSVTLVVLVVAIVIVVVVRSDEAPRPGAGPTTPGTGPTATINPEVDPCVVGRWSVTQHRETVVIEDVGRVTFTGGRNSSMDLQSDGSGVMIYPEGNAYQGTGGGRQIKLEIEGDVDFRFAARNGTFSLRDIEADAKARAFVDGSQVGTDEPFVPTDDPANYSCIDDTLTVRTAAYTTDFAKS